MEYVLLLLIAELFEAYIQNSKTLFGILQKLYLYYDKSIFLFFLVHPGFYLLLGIALLTNVLNMSMIFLIALKVFDIFYKIELMKKVFIEQTITVELENLLQWQIPSWFFFMGVSIYPPILWFALN